MERKLILDLITGGMAVLVFAFLWVGIFIVRKNVNWDSTVESVGYIFMCLIITFATVACLVNAYFWFTEHIIYIP